MVGREVVDERSWRVRRWRDWEGRREGWEDEVLVVEREVEGRWDMLRGREEGERERGRSRDAEEAEGR